MNKEKILKEYIISIKKYLTDNDCNVPFFICGGAVFSIIKGSTAYNDIDVFFYNEKDIKKVLNLDGGMISKYAKTITMIETIPLLVPIQFIHIVTGNPKEVLKTFDISSSMVAFTSNLKLIYGDDYSENMHINFKNFSDNTLERYLKYTTFKKIQDKNNKVYIKIFEHLIINFENNIPLSYLTHITTSGKVIIYKYLMNKRNEIITTEKFNFPQILHDIIVQKYKKEDRFEIFEYLVILCDFVVKNESSEFILLKILKGENSKLFFNYPTRNINQEVRNKYPEYFI
jgi:hypothetical protein